MQDFGPSHLKVHFPPDRGAASTGLEGGQSFALPRINYPEMEDKKEEENSILLKPLENLGWQNVVTQTGRWPGHQD